MPKGRNKVPKSDPAEENDGSATDSASVTSLPSEAGRGSETSEVFDGDGNEVDESSQQEQLEIRLAEFVDGTADKTAKTRETNLEGVVGILSKHYLYDYVIDRKMTLSDAFERCLKKGRGREKSLAAHCLTLLCVQLGPDSEELFKGFSGQLHTILMDPSESPEARKKCAYALGLCSLIAGSGMEDTIESMKDLSTVFSGSYMKGDGTVPTHPPEVALLHASAAQSWGLLLSKLPPSFVKECAESHLYKLPGLLLSSEVELRIAVGEVLALFYEKLRESDEDFEGENFEQLLELLGRLARDSAKYRTKKEKKAQRASFRDILRSVEDDEAPDFSVRFGTETLFIETWSHRLYYDALCQALGSGINLHLRDNELVRDFFELGTPLTPCAPGAGGRMTRSEKQYQNKMSDKARTKVRNKTKDKRVASFSES